MKASQNLRKEKHYLRKKSTMVSRRYEMSSECLLLKYLRWSLNSVSTSKIFLLWLSAPTMLSWSLYYSKKQSRSLRFWHRYCFNRLSSPRSIAVTVLFYTIFKTNCSLCFNDSCSPNLNELARCQHNLFLLMHERLGSLLFPWPCSESSRKPVV